MNAAKQIIVSHHGLNGIGNKTTISHIDHGQSVFLIVAVSTFSSFLPIPSALSRPSSSQTQSLRDSPHPRAAPLQSPDRSSTRARCPSPSPSSRPPRSLARRAANTQSPPLRHCELIPT